MPVFLHIISPAAKSESAECPPGRIRKLIDLIQFRLPQKGLEETIRGLLPIISELHLEVKQWMLNGNNQERYSKALNEEMRILSQSEEEANRLLAEALAAAESIGSLSFCIPFDAIEVMARVPNRSIQFFAKMNECVLFFEGLVFTHTLWRDKKLEVDPEELARIIRSTISHLGAYSTLIGLWQPDDADERQLVRNIKILAAHFRSKLGAKKLYKNRPQLRRE